MSVSKVILDGVTLIDLTSDTVTAGALLSGVTAHALDGTAITGTIALNSAGDLSASGSIVTVPSGYYAAAGSTAIAPGSFYVIGHTANFPNDTVSLDSSTGIITLTRSQQEGTATAKIQTSGYLEADTTVSNYYNITARSTTYALSALSTTNYTPSTATQIIAAGQYLTGVQTIAGDTNLIASNIMAGVSIFGVVGTASGGGGGTSMTTEEIWTAAASGWGVAAVMSNVAIASAVSSGWEV